MSSNEASRVDPRMPAGTSGQRGWTLPMCQAHRKPAQGQQMEASDQSESIQMQGRLGFRLSTLIGGRRDGNSGQTWSRNHKLISLAEQREISLLYRG